MSERISIIGLVGPSAVGKGYCKEAIKNANPDYYVEPVVVTTRLKRSTDGTDRLAGIPLQEFVSMKDSGVVVFAHQPFGPSSDWYGFSAESLNNPHKIVLTEVHIDNVKPFKDKYKDKIYLIALTAEKGYLERNIRERATEDEETIRVRLNVAFDEVRKIQKLEKQGLVDTIVSVNDLNRPQLGNMIIDIVSQAIK